MIGWARRGREDSARRADWWSTLTDEQKKRYVARQAEVDRKLLVFAGCLFPVLVAVLLWAIARLSP